MSFEDSGFTEVNNTRPNDDRGSNGQGWGNNQPQQSFNNNQGQSTPSNYQRNDGDRPSYGNNNSNGSNNRGNWNNNGGGGGGYRSNGGGNGGGGGNFRGGYQKGNFQRGGFQRNQEPEGPVELFLPYVGTGNKEAPPEVMQAIARIAADLDSRGYTLRTRGTEGPEDVFDKASKRKEVHLPWKGFLDKESKFTFTTEAAKELAGKFHPSFDGLKPAIQIFLAANVRMIMGKDLKAPALFMITWSEDGAETLQEKTARTGNAGHCIAIACALKIPVFNLGKQGAEARLTQYLGTKQNVQEESLQPATQQPAQQPNQPGNNYGQQPGNYQSRY